VAFIWSSGLAQDLAQLPDVIDRVAPSVVSIHVVKAVPAASQDPKDVPKESRPEPDEALAQGSGMVVSADGYILTAASTLENADSISIVLANGTRLAATVIVIDVRTDVALLKVTAGPALTPVVLANSDQLRRGQSVFAIGNPFGLTGSVSLGIVSALARDIGSGPYDHIQTDASINRGNAGGPLFNLQGEVVGMINAIYSPTGGSVGIGFAIPSNLLGSVLEQMRSTGTVERGWLGIKIRNVTDDEARSLGLDHAYGALVNGITQGGPAADTELEVGDAILSVNDRTIQDSRALARLIAGFAPSTGITLGVIGKGGRRSIRLKLGRQPTAASTPIAASHAIEVAELGLSLDQAAGPEPGVRIASVAAGKEAEQKGLKPGDTIADVGGKPVATPVAMLGELNLARRQGKESVIVRVVSGGQPRFVELRLGPAGSTP
jgi:serine protease Do